MEDSLRGGCVVVLGHVLLPYQRVVDGEPGPGAGLWPALSAVNTGPRAILIISNTHSEQYRFWKVFSMRRMSHGNSGPRMSARLTL